MSPMLRLPFSPSLMNTSCKVPRSRDSRPWRRAERAGRRLLCCARSHAKPPTRAGLHRRSRLTPRAGAIFSAFATRVWRDRMSADPETVALYIARKRPPAGHDLAISRKLAAITPRLRGRTFGAENWNKVRCGSNAAEQVLARFHKRAPSAFAAWLPVVLGFRRRFVGLDRFGRRRGPCGRKVQIG
jgi:hypothetical protein